MLISFSSRIWYYEGQEETDRPFLYYLLGSRKSAVIDAGNSPRHLAEFYAALKENALPLPDYTIITHWHWDHTFALSGIHGKSFASRKTNQKLSEVSEWKWDDASMKAREENGEDIFFCNECIRKEYPDRSEIKVVPADFSVEERTVLSLGDCTLVLIPFDSPHSRDALYIYIPEEKALAVGDAFCPDFYDGGGKLDPDKAYAMLSLWKTLSFETVLPGHDAPCSEKELTEYIREQLATEDAEKVKTF